jgi:hypothetical protein
VSEYESKAFGSIVHWGWKKDKVLGVHLSSEMGFIFSLTYLTKYIHTKELNLESMLPYNPLSYLDLQFERISISRVDSLVIRSRSSRARFQKKFNFVNKSRTPAILHHRRFQGEVQQATPFEIEEGPCP